MLDLTTNTGYIYSMATTNTIMRVERIIINRGHPNYTACKKMCGHARHIYNAALYQMRQALFSGQPIGHSQADKILKKEYRDLYQQLPSAASQRIIQVLGQDWKSWLAAKRDFEKSPHKYKRRPKLPNYARAAKTVTIGRNGFAISGGKLRLLKQGNTGFQPVKVICCYEQIFNAKKEDTQVCDV